MMTRWSFVDALKKECLVSGVRKRKGTEKVGERKGKIVNYPVSAAGHSSGGLSGPPRVERAGKTKQKRSCWGTSCDARQINALVEVVTDPDSSSPIHMETLRQYGKQSW